MENVSKLDFNPGWEHLSLLNCPCVFTLWKNRQACEAVSWCSVLDDNLQANYNEKHYDQTLAIDAVN